MYLSTPNKIIYLRSMQECMTSGISLHRVREGPFLGSTNCSAVGLGLTSGSGFALACRPISS